MIGSSVVRDVILRDGETLRLRAPKVEDAAGLTRFFADLSERSRYLRFHGARAPGAGLATPFLDPDWSERGSLVGTVRADGEERVVALASWARLREASTNVAPSPPNARAMPLPIPLPPPVMIAILPLSWLI